MNKRNLNYYVFLVFCLSIVFSSESINAQSDKSNTNENKINDYEITIFVEEMPRFPGCEDKNSLKEKEDCAKGKMLEYVYRNLIYPDTARIKGTQGQTVLRFVVKKDGTIDQVRIVRDIGDGCGEAVKKVIESMNQMQERWIPGKNGGKNVNTQYILPVKFELQGNDGKSINNTELPHLKTESNRMIFKVVDQMPRFPGCEDKISDKEKDDCAKSKLLEFIYKNLKYPEEARKNQVEGQVVLQFVITKTGTLENIKIVLEIGGGCGYAAKSVIETMNDMSQKWIPGKQNGQNVDVLYTLPVKFNLEDARNSVSQPPKQLVDYFSQEVHWKECLELDNMIERTMCTFNKISDFVQHQIKYPEEALKNNIEGYCKVRAYFDERGNLNKTEMIKDIGYGCGEEALRIVKNLPTMEPAEKSGKPIEGSLIIPVYFTHRKKDEFKIGRIPGGAMQANNLGISEDKFSVNINPSKEIVKFSLSNCLREDLTVTLTDMQGNLLFQKKYKNSFSMFTQQIDIHEYNVDLLMLSVTQGDKTITKKVIVKK